MRRRDSLLNSKVFVRLISIVLGFFVWIIVNSSATGELTNSSIATTATTVRSVPVIVETASDMVAASVRPNQMSVNVVGGVLGVATVQAEPSGIRVRAQAQRLGPGVHEVPVSVANVPTNAVSYSPQYATVAVDIERRGTASFAPQVRVLGSPAPGFEALPPVQTQSQVVVTGPAALVRQVAQVQAQVNIDSGAQAVVQNARLVALSRKNKPVTGVTLLPDAETITVQIRERTRIVPLVATTDGVPAAGWIVSGVSITPAKVQVSGSPELLARVSAISLPPIDVAKWRKSRTLNVSIPIPFTGGRLDEPIAQVTVQVSPSAATTLYGIPVTLVGTKGNLSYQMGTINTTIASVMGPAAAVGALQAQDVQAYVDVSGLRAGETRKLPIGLALPPTFEAVQVAPAYVQISAQGKK